MKKRLICSAALLAVLLLLTLLGGCESISISLDKPEPAVYVFDIVYDSTQGNAYSESKDGNYTEGESITAHAVGGNGMDFMCWTTGGYLDDGGTDVSHDPDYTFELQADTWLYANFKSEDLALVCYHLNGGAVADTGEDSYLQQFSLEYYLYPNALAEMDTFVRDGYTLIEYNTEPDGSGEAINPGGKVFVDTGRIIDLYCVWSQQTDPSYFTFDYNEANDGWEVSSYRGSLEEVSIPSSYDGSPVVGIAAGALTGANMKTLVIPKCVKYIQDYSCNDCPLLEKLYIFDSLTYLSDLSFDNDTALATLCFNAATPPRFTTWFNNHTKKVEVLCYTQDVGPRIICIGGSSTTYAIDCEHLEEYLDEDYTVINCGSNGANLWNMTSQWVMHFANEGDVLLQLPEYSAWQLGGVIFRWETFRSFEGCYNAFRWFDATYFYDIFDCFCEFLEARADMDPTSYEDYRCTLAPNGYYNDQGTLNVHVRGSDPDFWSGRSVYLCGDWLYDYMVYYCNYSYEALRSMGVTPLMSWTPFSYNALTNEAGDPAIDAFQSYLDEKLDLPIISNINEYFYTGEHFFDDDYHLSYESRLAYTEQIAADLNTYFASVSE